MIGGRTVRYWKKSFEDYLRSLSVSNSVVGDLVQRGNITSEGCSRWCLGWRKERFVWEKHEKEKLLTMISNVRWCSNDQDRLVWVGDGDNKQEYIIKYEYSVLKRRIKCRFMRFLSCYGLLILFYQQWCALGGYYWIDYQPDLT